MHSHVLHRGVDASKEETKATGARTDKVSQILQTDLTRRVFLQEYTRSTCCIFQPHLICLMRGVINV